MGYAGPAVATGDEDEDEVDPPFLVDVVTVAAAAAAAVVVGVAVAAEADDDDDDADLAAEDSTAGFSFLELFCSIDFAVTPVGTKSSAFKEDVDDEFS